MYNTKLVKSMKLFIKSIAFTSILILIFSVLPYNANAQFGDPGEDPDAPIDGGISVLVAAGIGYGAKKMRDSKKKKAEEIFK